MQISFYDEENRLEKITKLGDSQEQLNRIVEWKIFVPVLNRAIPRIVSEKGGETGERQSDDVQDAGNQAVVQAVARANGIPNQRANIVHEDFGDGHK